jgi:hypothetical protein
VRPEATTDQNGRFVLDVPAHQSSLRVVRTSVAAVGSLSLDIERVEHLSLAVDELCSVLLGLAGGERIELEVTTNDHDVVVTGHRSGATVAAWTDARFDISRHILASLGADYEIAVSPDGAGFRARFPSRVSAAAADARPS